MIEFQPAAGTSDSLPAASIDQIQICDQIQRLFRLFLRRQLDADA
jgi:hypothetical protein